MQWATTEPRAESREPRAESRRDCDALTRREQDVAALLPDHTQPEIAELLVVGIETVKTHVENIRTKLHAGSGREAGRIYAHKSPEPGDAETPPEDDSIGEGW